MGRSIVVKGAEVIYQPEKLHKAEWGFRIGKKAIVQEETHTECLHIRVIFENEESSCYVTGESLQFRAEDLQ